MEYLARPGGLFAMRVGFHASKPFYLLMLHPDRRRPPLLSGRLQGHEG